MSHKKFTLLDPLVIYREDLFALEALMHESVVCGKCDFMLNVTIGDNDFSATPFHSFEELFKAKVPPVVDKLYIESKQTENNAVTKFIRVIIGTKMADLRVYSDTDIDWVNTTSDKILKFFEGKKPWYAGIKVAMAPLFNVTMILSLFLAASAAIHKHSWMFLFPLALFTYSLGGLIKGYKQKIFPFSRINCFPKEDDLRSNVELFALVGWLILISISVPVIFFHNYF